jgi:hypothetical protein
MYIRVFIDGVLSNVQTLTVSPVGGGGKTVTVGTQSGPMIAGALEVVSFSVTTTGISNGTYNITGAVANLPTGVNIRQPTTFSITDGNGTLNLASTVSASSGSYANLTLTIDGATSAAFTLVISPAGGG